MGFQLLQAQHGERKGSSGMGGLTYMPLSLGSRQMEDQLETYHAWDTWFPCGLGPEQG